MLLACLIARAALAGSRQPATGGSNAVA
jgi:hypothetical protein